MTQTALVRTLLSEIMILEGRSRQRKELAMPGVKCANLQIPLEQPNTTCRLQYAQLFTAKSLFLSEPTTLHLDEPFKTKKDLRLKTFASTHNSRSSVAETFVWTYFTLPRKRTLKKGPPFNSS